MEKTGCDLELYSSSSVFWLRYCRSLATHDTLSSNQTWTNVSSDQKAKNTTDKEDIIKETTIKIEGCDSYENACKLKTCLAYYGEFLSEISEITHYDPDPDAQPVGNGSYQIRMKLNRQIPNFIPAAGRKIRISYTNCTFLCSNCFRAHSTKSCKNTKVMWIQYVKRFMSNNENLKEEWYGKWWNIINTEYTNKERSTSQSESLITKQLKAIREKTKNDQRLKEKGKEARIESHKETTKPLRIEIEKSKSKSNQEETWSNIASMKHTKYTNVNVNANAKVNPMKKSLTEDETIMRDYDVEFYMNRGLTKNEAINYIKNKLSVKNLWSKMSKSQ